MEHSGYQCYVILTRNAVKGKDLFYRLVQAEEKQILRVAQDDSVAIVIAAGCQASMSRYGLALYRNSGKR